MNSHLRNSHSSPLIINTPMHAVVSYKEALTLFPNENERPDWLKNDNPIFSLPFGSVEWPHTDPKFKNYIDPDEEGSHVASFVAFCTIFFSSIGLFLPHYTLDVKHLQGTLDPVMESIITTGKVAAKHNQKIQVHQKNAHNRVEKTNLKLLLEVVSICLELVISPKK